MRGFKRFQEVSRTGTVGSTKHCGSVPKCLHKIQKFIKNSEKVHQNPSKTDENFMEEWLKNGQEQENCTKIDKECQSVYIKF